MRRHFKCLIPATLENSSLGLSLLGYRSDLLLPLHANQHDWYHLSVCFLFKYRACEESVEMFVGEDGTPY